MGKDVQFAFRIEAALREEFVRTCKSMDRPAGQVLREYMREFVGEHIQAPLFSEPIAHYRVQPIQKKPENS